MNQQGNSTIKHRQADHDLLRVFTEKVGTKVDMPKARPTLNKDGDI